MKNCKFSDVGHGDHIEVHFVPPVADSEGETISAARGQVTVTAGMAFLVAASHRNRHGMPKVLDLNPREVSQVRLIETSTQAKDRKHIEARGEIVYSWSPKDAEELEEQLDHLAQMIATEEDNRVLGGRKGQLELQFHDVADQVRLAKMKRNYILTRARVGDNFHPWTTRDDRVFRIECVRPLPADFELSPWDRKDRERRRAEAIRIFGQAELETREWMSALKNRGYDCRRPHPNAQEFLVRAYLGEHSKYDMVVAPSANGLWEVSAKDAQNKREAGLRARCLRDGHVRALTNVVAEIMN